MANSHVFEVLPEDMKSGEVKRLYVGIQGEILTLKLNMGKISLTQKGTGSLVVKAPHWNTGGPEFKPQPVHLFHYHSRSILDKEFYIFLHFRHHTKRWHFFLLSMGVSTFSFNIRKKEQLPESLHSHGASAKTSPQHRSRCAQLPSSGTCHCYVSRVTFNLVSLALTPCVSSFCA